MTRIESLISTALDDPDAGWSMGSFGAIAEFHQVEGDPAADRPDHLSAVTSRGGIRFADLSDLQVVAYESLSAKEGRWGQSVALCLPAASARVASRSVLTRLGADTEAIRPKDRNAILFDMGLDQAQVDFCIRTDDLVLIELLEAQDGRSLFEPDNPAMAAILRTHPHRVALTAFGRCEVYQSIGGTDTGGISPEGPHTHVLPKLLASKRSHSANIPIPGGLTVCGGLHPASPIANRLGLPIPFDRDRFEAFQSLLEEFGPDRWLAAKRHVWETLGSDRHPADLSPEWGRYERQAAKIAERQWVQLRRCRD